MTARRTTLIVAPFLLVLAFAGHLVNVLVLEPGLGFSTPEDFYDAGKFLPVIRDPVWLLGGIYHLCAGAAVILLAHELSPGRTASSYVKMFGVAAGVLFVGVCLFNVVGMRELAALARQTSGDTQALYGAFLISRTVALNGAVLFLGLFLVLGNATRGLTASGNAAVRYVGFVAGVAFFLVPVIPTAVPIAILSSIAWGSLAGIVAFSRRNT